MNRHNGSDESDWIPPRSSRLLDQVRERVRYLRQSLQTEKVYVYWPRLVCDFGRQLSAKGRGVGHRTIGCHKRHPALPLPRPGPVHFPFGPEST